MANGFHLEPIPFTIATASATQAGFPAGNTMNDYMGMVMKTTSTAGEKVLAIDLGADMSIDCAILLGLASSGTLSAYNMTVRTATAAQGSGFGAGNYTEVQASAPILAGATMPTSGRGKALVMFNAITARYVRFGMTGSGTNDLTIAKAIVGKRLQLAQNFKYGAAFGVRPLGSLEFSARGVMLRRMGKKLRGLGISYAANTKAEVEAAILPMLERVGNDTPVVIVTDPDVDANRQNRMYFGFLTGNLGSVWAKPSGFETDFNLSAVD